MLKHCQRQMPTSGFEPVLRPSLTVSLSAMTLWNSKPQENLQSLKYLSQLRNLTCRALKGQYQRSVALSRTVLCGTICDFYSLISPFSVSALYASPRKAIPHRCICTNRFGCPIADRGWAHFEMMTAKQLIHLSQARFFALSREKIHRRNPPAKLISLLGSDLDIFSCNDVQKSFGFWVRK